MSHFSYKTSIFFPPYLDERSIVGAAVERRRLVREALGLEVLLKEALDVARADRDVGGAIAAIINTLETASVCIILRPVLGQY